MTQPTIWQLRDEIIDIRTAYQESTRTISDQNTVALQDAIEHLGNAASRIDRDLDGLDELKKAFQAVQFIQVDIAISIGQVAFSLGYECIAHGYQSFEAARGGYHFSGGETWDDIAEYDVCPMCYQRVEAAPIAVELVQMEPALS